jgi:hypothetical protein
LALPAGEYTVQVVQSTGVSRSAPVALAENSSFTLGPMDMAPVGLEETRSRGETAVDMTDDDSITIETSDGVIVISREGIQLIRDDLLGNSSITSNDISTMEEETESRDLSELPLNERNRIQRRYKDEVPFALTFVPGVGTYNVSNKVVNTELGFMAYAGALEGMQLGYLGAYTKDHSNGLQVGGIYSITRGSFSGLQASGTYGHIQGELEGAQLSGVVGITTGAINGAQFSGVLNLSRDNIDGIQVSGFGNFTRGSLEGAQIGGFINYVKEDLDGAQIAGFINIVEGDATGTQIGIINIGNSLDGMPIGLLNIYKEGITTLGAWTGMDDRAETYYSLMTGNDWFYNHFFMGGEGPEIWTDPNACVGFGIGLREELFKGIALDVDVNFKTQMYQDYEIDENNPAEQQWENYWTDSWGNQNTLLGRVVLTTTWGIQPYWGYTAEIQKSDLLDGEDLVYQFEEPDLEGYGIKFNMIMGIRVDLY